MNNQIKKQLAVRKETQSDVFLKMTENKIKQEAPDLELPSIIDDQTADNEANYLTIHSDNKDSNKETILNKISKEDLF